MTSTPERAKAARKELENLAENLNCESLVPEQSYRRNHPNYPYLCYINNAIGLFSSENYHVIPIFIARASQHSLKRPTPEGLERYRELATEYLLKLTDFINLHTDTNLKHLEDFSEEFYAQYKSYQENA